MSEAVQIASDGASLAYRRGMVLTGSADGALAVLRGVLIRHDDLDRVGETLLARSAVQEARAWNAQVEQPPAPPAALLPGVVRQLWQTVSALPYQQREAWVFLRLEGLSDVEAARAMDCSRTALQEVHLAGAQATLAPLMGAGYDNAVDGLRAWLASVDPAPALATINADLRAAGRKRRLWRLVMFLGFAACCALMWWVLLDLQEANRQEVAREKMLRELEDRYSLPLRDEEKESEALPDPDLYPVHGPAKKPPPAEGGGP